MRAATEFDRELADEDRVLRLLPEDRIVDVDAARVAVTDLLLAFGFDVADEGLRETPRRVVAALGELVTPLPFQMTTFANADGYDGLVLARGIPFHSLCQHHLLPFIGIAHIGYLPAERIVGLSKLGRTVDHFARSLQMQERLTTQLANCLQGALRPKGVGVVLEAEHLCMSLRGTRKPAKTVTSALLGTIRHDARARHEFLALTGAPGTAE